ncbi:MAG: hypothetical protein WAK93_20265 [Solirubrobacteraceae bacterium]
MTNKAMNTYLNDHLAGAMLGSSLAKQIHDRHQGSRLGSVIGPLAVEIEEDRQTLLDLMERMGTSQNPVKQALGWIAELTSRIKFSGLGSGSSDHGAFMALESLALGVEGKLSMWKALQGVADRHPPLAETDLDGLLARAQAQREILERERLTAAGEALSGG